MADCKKSIVCLLMEGTRPPIKYTNQKILSLNQIKLLDLSTSVLENTGDGDPDCHGVTISKMQCVGSSKGQMT